MKRCIYAGVLFAVSTAWANPRTLDWVDLMTGAPPGDPTMWAAIGAPSMPAVGSIHYFMLDQGANADSNGGAATHFDPEGLNGGAFQGQAWVRWDNILTRFKTQADAALGTNAWSIQKIWVLYDPASGLAFGTGPGLVSAAEVSALNVRGGFADWGDKSQADVDNGASAATQLPAGYHGFNMPVTAGATSIVNFLLFDGAGQPFQSSSQSFRVFTSGMDSATLPVQDSFCLYLAPIDDIVGGQGAAVALSYDGFMAGTSSFAPIVLFELVKLASSISTNNFPIASNHAQEAPFTTMAGVTCTAVLSAFDADLGDTLTFNINSDGSLGGTLEAFGAVSSDGLGNRFQSVRYTIQPGDRGEDVFDFTVSDGSVTAPGAASFMVRGNAVRNTVAFGANQGVASDSMRLYTGAAVPNGGTNGRLDRLIGKTFAQSTEFDNYNGIRHNPNGNLFALSFGPTDGAGELYVYPTQGGCSRPTGDTTAGTTVFIFNSASGLSDEDANVGSLSVSPNNSRIAVQGVNTQKLYIFDYAAGMPANVGRGGANAISTLTLAAQIDLGGSVWFENRSFGTTWLNDNVILTIDAEGSLQSVDITDINNPVVSGLVTTPIFVSNTSSADIEYNPEVSPYVFVTIGIFDSGAQLTTNLLIVYDPVGLNVVPQADVGGGPQMWTEYQNPALGAQDETFREIGLDCLGNLFIGTFVNNNNRVNVKYLSNAVNVAAITGGYASLQTWRTLAGDEGTSNFSGLDVAAGTTIGMTGLCGSNPPIPAALTTIAESNAQCMVTLTATNPEQNETLTFFVGAGSNGGTLALIPPATSSDFINWSQNATYQPAANFHGVETFSFTANDGRQLSAPATITFVVRGDLVRDDVVFGANLANDRLCIRAYHGAHVLNGGTNGVEEILSGRGFAQSMEFDNYNDVYHNPAGNLFSLDFGTVANGGGLLVSATNAECQGNGTRQIFQTNNTAGIPTTRISGLSVSPDNTKIAIYGYDTRTIYILNYTPGADVGRGGPNAATVSYSGTSINVAGILPPGWPTATLKSLATAWLDNSTLLLVNVNGDLYTVGLDGTITLREPNPQASLGATSISSVDVEFNDRVSAHVFVAIGDRGGAPAATRNHIYVVSPQTWNIVPQSGGAAFTDQTDNPNVGTFREIAFDSAGNLFIGTFAEANRVNIRFIANAGTNPGGITNDSSIVYNALDADFTSLPNFSGLDVAAGSSAALCSLYGDMNGDGLRDGDDLPGFVTCLIENLNQPPPPGCTCADVATNNVLNSDDAAALVAILLAGS